MLTVVLFTDAPCDNRKVRPPNTLTRKLSSRQHDGEQDILGPEIREKENELVSFNKTLYNIDINGVDILNNIGKFCLHKKTCETVKLPKC